MSQPNPFLEFLDRYYGDPVLFVREVLGADPDQMQSDLMRAVARGDRRIAVRSGHGVGKTTVLAWIIVWFACTRVPQKCVCTAPTSAQLFDALAAETKTWFNKLPPLLRDRYEIKTDAIVLIEAPSESFISFATSRAETPEALAGKHSDNLLLICDEASGIPEPVFEAGSGSMSGHNCQTLLAGNPVRTSGLFFDAFHKLRDMWTRFHISCVDHPRVSSDFVEDMARRYGRDSNAFRVRVEGNFPVGDDDTVIPLHLVDSALVRDVKPLRVRPVWGVDCARGGADKSALAKRRGNVLMEKVKLYDTNDTMVLVGYIKAEWDATPVEDRPSEILVDVIGIGAGVNDRLAELKLPARGINVAESPSMGEKYAKLRDELWFKGREYFEKLDCNLCNDEELAAELTGPRYEYLSSGKRKVEGKKEMKKRGVHSPNRADAFLLTLAGVAAIAAGNGNHGWTQPLRRIIKGIV